MDADEDLIKRLEAFDESLRAAVRKHGWNMTHIPQDPEGPSFSFTTGLWLNKKHAEAIVFGVHPYDAYKAFAELYTVVDEEVTVPLGERLDDTIGGRPAYAFSVAERYFDDFLGTSQRFYREEAFPCVQLVWSDAGGMFPWEEGFDSALRDLQPDLSERGWVNEIRD